MLTLLVLLYVMGWIAVSSGLAVILLALPVASLVTLCTQNMCHLVLDAHIVVYKANATHLHQPETRSVRSKGRTYSWPRPKDIILISMNTILRQEGNSLRP